MQADAAGSSKLLLYLSVMVVDLSKMRWQAESISYSRIASASDRHVTGYCRVPASTITNHTVGWLVISNMHYHHAATVICFSREWHRILQTSVLLSFMVRSEAGNNGLAIILSPGTMFSYFCLCQHNKLIPTDSSSMFSYSVKYKTFTFRWWISNI